MLTVDANVWVAALDESDPVHAESVRFLEAARDRSLVLHGPALLLVETACALARRSENADVALAAAATMRRLPGLRLEPHDRELEIGALELGTRLLLRGADSYYVAVAARQGTPLITWDRELLDRAGGVSPARWLEKE